LNVEASGQVSVSLARGSSSVVGGTEVVYCNGGSCDSDDWKLSFHVDNLVGLQNQNLAVGAITEGYLMGGMRLMGVYQSLEIPVKIHRYSSNTYLVEPVDPLFFPSLYLGRVSSFSKIMNGSDEELQNSLRLYFKFIVQR